MKRVIIEWIGDGLTVTVEDSDEGIGEEAEHEPEEVTPPTLLPVGDGLDHQSHVHAGGMDL